MNQPELPGFSETTLRKHEGTSCITEYRIQTVRQLMVREEVQILKDPNAIVALFRSAVATASWFDALKECVIVVALDIKNRPLGWTLVSLGSATASLAHPRDVLRPVLIAGAVAFVMVHNHPSGDCSPSSADMAITRTIREAAKTVEVQFLDHVIVGQAALDPDGRDFYSFRLSGIL